MTEHTTAELSPEEQAHAWRLVRRCDAYSTLRWVLEGAAERGEVRNSDDLENARAELAMQEAEAESELARFKAEHGIPEL